MPINPHLPGIHGWAIFSLVGMLLSLMSYRENLPMTMKSCFYPLIGDNIFGWIGDFIDVFSIIATLFGVCTSLGIGAKQVAKGLAIIHTSINAEDTTMQVSTKIFLTKLVNVRYNFLVNNSIMHETERIHIQ